MQNLAGTNPIHNKKPKKADKGELDDEDIAFKAKQQAGAYPHTVHTHPYKLSFSYAARWEYAVLGCSMI